MSTPLEQMTALGVRDAFLRGERTARSIVGEQLSILKERDQAVRAFLTVMEAEALAQADALDRKLAQGARMGKLASVPVAVKDNICTRGVRTTCASRILDGYVPPYDAHVVEELRRQDAVIVGKTNLDEFAMGSSTENSGFQVTRNPWDTGRIPGGSSGGSAAAVAARMAPLALGSDTGGSIRQPAALCGVVGLKPTYGRVSRYGLVAFASSLDQIGPFARTAQDAALLMEAIAAPDSRDSTCTDRPAPDYLAALQQPVRGLTFGLPREFFIRQGVDPEIVEALEQARKLYETLGVRFRELSLPHSRIDVEGDRLSSYAIACYYIAATAEASSNLARYDGVRYGHRTAQRGEVIETYSRTRGEGFGEEVKRRIMLGTYALSSGYYDAYYLKAGRVRRLIQQDFDRAWDEVDLIFCPVSPTPAFRIGEKVGDPLAMYLSDIFTISANLAGICGISVPCGFTRAGLPVGMQLMGRQWDEGRLLAAAHAYQQVTDWHAREPSQVA